MARKEGAKGHGKRGLRRDPWKLRPGEALSLPSRGDQGSRGAFATDVDPSPGGGGGAAEGGGRFPGPSRPSPRASAPGAQVWPGHQVQSALAAAGVLPARPPSGRPPCLPACTARPPPWAQEPGQLGGRSGARLGAWARGVEAPGQVTTRRSRIQSAGPLAGKFSRDPHTFPRAGGPGGDRRGLVPDGPARPVPATIGWSGGGAGRDSPPSEASAVLGSTWRGRALRPEPAGAGCTDSPGRKQVCSESCLGSSVRSLKSQRLYWKEQRDMTISIENPRESTKY